MKKSVALSIGAALILSIVMVSFVGVKSRILNPTVNMKTLVPTYAIDSKGSKNSFYPSKEPLITGYDYSFSDDDGVRALPYPYVSGLRFEIHVEITPDNTSNKAYSAYLKNASQDADKYVLYGDSTDGYVLSILSNPGSGNWYSIFLTLKGLDSSELSCVVAFYILGS